ncbi:HNH endonuclease [Rhodopirellula bahusiensis]|uniref:HNH domain-containing protein n=1 Tax=Rhodopirellula bahusiensis TaxID=2014065 RepID=A0A2G1WCC7_9BACT|nr:HNH endonuclease signature motif containing protein [Rhodopirellula bahusiensis]PHQ36687.1 hypothetical protein CEE69_04885 [Rhodopirellula bahusiensis]
MTTVPQARRAIKSSLKRILDPKPTDAEIDRLWGYFNSACAYCGIKIDRKSRTGHNDHLVAESEGGVNGLSNLILSCNICNGDEKLASDWSEFLEQKCGGKTQLFDERRQKILNWIELSGGRTRITPQDQALVDEAFNQINAVLTARVEELRSHRDA